MPIVDIYDGEPWSEMDIRDLRLQLEQGNSIEEVAKYLCRAGTVDEVRYKAEELGLLEAARH
jgi:hypothetical protein